MNSVNSIDKIPKPVVFAVVAAFGCIVAALLAEPLFLGKPPTIIIPSPPESPGAFFVLCIDDSGSMGERTGPGRTRRDDVKEAAREFVLTRNLEKEKIGIVVFSNTSQVFLSFSRDRDRILTTIRDYRLGGGTMFAGALQDALNLFEKESEIAQINHAYRNKIENINEKISEVNQLIETGRIRGEKIEQLLPQTVPKIVLFFTDGENFDQPQTLQKAQELREKGIKIYVIAALDVANRGRQSQVQNYLAQMTGDASQVYMVDDAQIRDAFEQVTQQINAELTAAQPDFLRNVSQRQADDGSDGIEIIVGTLRTMQIAQAVIWSMLLCLGMCICIVFVQNHTMRKPLFIQNQFTTLCIGGAVGGLLAGFCGDTIFQIMPVVFIGRLAGLCILGAILGFAMSFYIANLDRKWALIGGALGGFLGALGFAVSTTMAGQTSGRLIGAAIIGACIGAMIGWVEQFYRKVWLMVLYDSRNFTQVNLGSRAITVGSDANDTVFVKDAGPKAATFLVVGDKIQFTDANGMQSLMPGNKVKVGSVELVVCSKDVKFAPSKFYPMKMSRARELMNK